MDIMVEDFIKNVELNYSKSQFRIYQKGIERFLNYIKYKVKIKNINQLERRDIEGYIDYLWNVEYRALQNQYRPSFVYRQLTAVSKFFEFITIHQSNYCPRDLPKPNLLVRSDFPASNRISVKHYPKWFNDIFYNEVTTRPIPKFKNRRSYNRKFKTQLLLLFYTGIRIGDLCKLNKDCIVDKYGGKWLVVYASKVGREYEIPIVNELFLAIEEYKKEYLKEIEAAPEYKDQTSNRSYQLLFPASPSMRTCIDTLRKKVKAFCGRIIEIAKERGISDDEIKQVLDIGLSPHKFRHNAAIRLIRLGADPMLVAEFLGHKDLTMAQAYIGEDEAYIDEVMQELSDEGILDGARITPGPEMWEKNQIMLHSGVVKKVETGWCTYINGEAPCGENPYTCWKCEKLKPDSGEEYKSFLEEQRKIHIELMNRDEELGLDAAFAEEQFVIKRIDEFLNEVNSH